MDTFLTIILAVAAVLVVKRLIFPVAGVRRTRDALDRGAPVIDVRTEPEYRHAAIDGAENLPLDRIESAIAEAHPDKAQPLLLHCLTGTRSGMARSKLKSLGYHEVYNLGSYPRARRVLAQARKRAP